MGASPAVASRACHVGCFRHFYWLELKQGCLWGGSVARRILCHRHVKEQGERRSSSVLIPTLVGGKEDAPLTIDKQYRTTMKSLLCRAKWLSGDLNIGEFNPKISLKANTILIPITFTLKLPRSKRRSLKILYHPSQT